MDTTPHSIDLAAATAWLARADVSLRDTVLRHWAHHGLGDGQTVEALRVDRPEQMELVRKAVGEHFPALLPDLEQAVGLSRGPQEAAALSMFDRNIMGEDDVYLRTHTPFRVLAMRGGGQVVLEAAPHLQDRDTLNEQVRALFPQARFTLTEKPIKGTYRVVMTSYDFKQGIAALMQPMGWRALPTRTADERAVLEEEYRLMTHAPARPKERDMEEAVQDMGLKEAFAEVTRDHRLMFTDNLKGGVYSIAVRDERSLIPQAVHALLETGAIKPGDAAIVANAEGQKQLHITPAALSIVNESLFHGIAGKTVQVASVMSPAADKVRRGYFSELRVDAARRELVQGQVAAMGADERAEIRTLLGGKDVSALLPEAGVQGPKERVALDVLSRATEQVASKHPAPNARAFDVAQLRQAIANGRAVLQEKSFWKHLEDAQLASHHNTIREDTDAALADLDQLLGSQPFSQRGLSLLVNEGRFAEAIRNTGHFLSIVQDAGTKGYDAGADQYQQAFHLTRAALVPTSSEAKAASYHLRAIIGKTGFGETVSRYAFMGLRPIFSSVQLAFEKPMLCGGAILGIATYSAMVPRQYSIPHMLNRAMHDIMEGLGVSHSHDSKGGLKLKKMVHDSVAEIKANSGGNAGHGNYWKGFHVGRKFGTGLAAATGAGMFVAFNLIEDVIVHIPLALLSVGVGTVGGATGRKVLSPVLNDIGDIAGRITPEPVRDAFRADATLIKQASEGSFLSRLGQGVRSFGRDVDEFGVVTTANHVTQAVGENMASLFNHAFGRAPQAASR